MPKRRFLAALGVTAGLLAGGATAVALGTPGVAGAQTNGATTTQPATPSDQPGTPAPGGAGGSGHLCQHMGDGGSGNGSPGTSSGSSSGTSTSGGGPGNASNLGFRGRFGGGFARV